MSNILCLGKDTNILLNNNTYKKISCIQIGDKIVSYNQVLSRFELVDVIKTAKSNHSIIVRLTLSDGKVIECTTDHPIWTEKKGWCSVDFKETIANYNVDVKALEVNDNCFILESGKISYSKLISIETLIGDFEMFVISGGDNHCFFANNILVHDENLTELIVKVVNAFSINTN